MNSTSFRNWLTDMKVAGLASTDADCAKLLDISSNAVVEMKRRGADRRTALACQALLAGLEPYEKR